MSFFNLTMLGYHSQIKEYQTKDDSFLPPIKSLDSNLKFHQLRTKHVRTLREPHQNFRRPLTCSQEVGWWTKDEPIKENLKWSHVKKHVFPKSEMTAFSDKMMLADKSFRLY
ncbi:unnamed protein product [Brachionus calyciflorus]|uniref:Uncharacterized protein n=1 Tax=Brachionus calyciflorus TaxID=104777 RepID=A0A813QKN3_9BILA|nr:unnamed protein product [Brachionus calyciflorus]